MMIALIAPLAVAVTCALALLKRAKTRMAGYALLAFAVCLALAAGGYTVGKDMAKRDSLAHSARSSDQT